MKHLSPAEVCIQEAGSAMGLAKALGLRPSSVWRWAQPKEEGGRGGHVPAKRQAKILLLAQERGWDITADDLILGRSEE